MAKFVIMPKLGMTMEAGVLTKWHKAEGDAVSKGDILFDLETDKLSNSVEAEEDGVLRKILVQEGQEVPILTNVAVIAAADEDISALTGEAPAAAPQAAAPKAEAPKAAPAAGGKKSILIVGGGPGGYVAAIRAAQLGADVTVVEKEHLGGTCLNIGCIPTKCLLHSAELLEEIREQGAEIGVKVGNVEVDFPQIIAHKDAVSHQLTSGIASLFRANKVKHIAGTATFTA